MKSYINSPHGILAAVFEEGSLISLNFTTDTTPASDKTTPESKALQKQLLEYFEGQRTDFSIPLKVTGTKFQESVWQELLKIGYGKTASYSQIAKNIGNRDAARAVGMACHRNPIAIIIPCHRIMGANNKLTGYAGGLNIKKNLLIHERMNS